MNKYVLALITCFFPLMLSGMNAADLGGLAAVSAPCQYKELENFFYGGCAQIIGIALLFTKVLQAQLCNSKTDSDAVRVCTDLENLLKQKIEKTRKVRLDQRYDDLLPKADFEALTAWMDDVRKLTEATYRCAQTDVRITCFTTPPLFSAGGTTLLCPIKIVFKPVTEFEILSEPVEGEEARYEAIYRPFKRVAYIRGCELLRAYNEKREQLWSCCPIQ